MLQEDDDMAMEVEEGGDLTVEQNPFPFGIPGESPLPSPCPSPAPEEVPAELHTPTASEAPSMVPIDVDSVHADGKKNPAIPAGDGSQSRQPTRRSQRVNSSVEVEKKGSNTKRGKKRAFEQSEHGPSNLNDNLTLDNPLLVPSPSNKDAPVDAGNSTASTTPATPATTSATPALSVPPAKRSRVADPRSLVEARSSAFGFEVPSEAPEWFKKSFAMLSSKDLGGEWGLLVAAWARYENEGGLPLGLKLGTKNRPVAVKDWIQRARSPSWRPTIVSISSYAAEFTLWWQGLQPEWRILKGGRLLRVAGGDWQVLKRPGVNGLVSVMAGLFFWGFEVCDSSNKSEWLEMVVDVEYAISQLLAAI